MRVSKLREKGANIFNFTCLVLGSHFRLDLDLEAPGLESELDSQTSPGLNAESNLISDRSIPLVIYR